MALNNNFRNGAFPFSGTRDFRQRVQCGLTKSEDFSEYDLTFQCDLPFENINSGIPAQHRLWVGDPMHGIH
jgi:hypothetical protein